MQGQLTKATQEWASLFTNLPWRSWLKRAPVFITILLVILIAKALADITWLIIGPSTTQGNTGITSQAPSVTARSKSANNEPRLRNVASLHLFGVASSKPVARNNVPVKADRVTNLNIKLTGVFVSSVPEKSMAFITNSKKEQNVYLVGNPIESGAVLYAVYPDHVIIERNGQYERLNLPIETAGSSSATTTQRRNSRNLNQPSRTNQPVRKRTIRANDALKKLREDLLNEPQKFWTEVRIEPRQDENGQIKGFTFYHNNNQVMRAMGLRKGDIILQVNGQALSDPSVLAGLMSQLTEGQDMTLVIERRGNREEITIKM